MQDTCRVRWLLGHVASDFKGSALLHHRSTAPSSMVTSTRRPVFVRRSTNVILYCKLISFSSYLFLVTKINQQYFEVSFHRTKWIIDGHGLIYFSIMFGFLFYFRFSAWEKSAECFRSGTRERQISSTGCGRRCSFTPGRNDQQIPPLCLKTN